MGKIKNRNQIGASQYDASAEDGGSCVHPAAWIRQGSRSQQQLHIWTHPVLQGQQTRDGKEGCDHISGLVGEIFDEGSRALMVFRAH
jgi:hypothetical protein